jgi:nitrite reductase (NO-forming)
VPLALSTGHEIGLGVTAAAFIAFALASSFLFPRLRPQFPGGGLLAFVVVSVLFFFAMLTAVEVFGAESKKHGEHAAAGETTTEATTTAAATTTTAATTTHAATTTTAPTPQATTVQVTETEFKIALATTALKAGPVTFQVKNAGKIPHDLAIAGTSEKTKTIPPGGTAELKTTLKPGTVELYCSLPGHKQAGMDIKLNSS